jgi:hypothetical protein
MRSLKGAASALLCRPAVAAPGVVRRRGRAGRRLGFARPVRVRWWRRRSAPGPPFLGRGRRRAGRCVRAPRPPAERLRLPTSGGRRWVRGDLRRVRWGASGRGLPGGSGRLAPSSGGGMGRASRARRSLPGSRIDGAGARELAGARVTWSVSVDRYGELRRDAARARADAEAALTSEGGARRRSRRAWTRCGSARLTIAPDARAAGGPPSVSRDRYDEVRRDAERARAADRARHRGAAG